MHGYTSKIRTFETSFTCDRNIVDKNGTSFFAIYNTCNLNMKKGQNKIIYVNYACIEYHLTFLINKKRKEKLDGLQTSICLKYEKYNFCYGIY